MLLQVFKPQTEAVKFAQDELVNYLLKCRVAGDKVLLCLSGGSALAILDNFPSEVLGPHVTVTVLDERYSTDPKINNMAQIAATGFLEKAKANGCQLIDTRVKVGDSIEEVVVGYNMGLLRWIENTPKGKIVATVGMGPDGHTSGIIPGSIGFDRLFGHEQKNLVVGYEAINQPPEQKMRITTTFSFLENVAFAVMLVLGESKKDALMRLVADEGTLGETPARIWREPNNETLVVTDIKMSD